MAWVVSTHAAIEVLYGTFRHALKTMECTPWSLGSSTSSAAAGASEDLRGAGARAVRCLPSSASHPHRVVLLLTDGLASFQKSFDTLIAGLEKKTKALGRALVTSR